MVGPPGERNGTDNPIVDQIFPGGERVDEDFLYEISRLDPLETEPLPMGRLASDYASLKLDIDAADVQHPGDSLRDVILLSKSAENRRFGQTTLDPEQIIEILPALAASMGEVMFAAWQRSRRLQEMAVAEPLRKLDMPVAAGLANLEGQLISPIFVSKDNELGNPIAHAEHLALQWGVEQHQAGNPNFPEMHFKNVIPLITQPSCYMCEGQLYGFKIQGVVTGSQNNGVEGVEEQYKAGKYTGAEMNLDHARMGRPGYATDWILDLGLVGWQRAIHLGIERDPEASVVKVLDKAGSLAVELTDTDPVGTNRATN